MKKLGIHKDSITGANYELFMVDSAKEYSESLKSAYKSLGINPEEFNTSKNDGNNVAENPPKEIYEYQNFFVLKRDDGNEILLDGFRRLLWYNAPDSPVMIRVYNQSDINDQQILSLMVSLNHFKFFSNSSWQERGFGLLLKAAFDIDITKFRKAFEAYLSSDQTKNKYWIDKIEVTSKINKIKGRITNKRFVSDMKFISTLNKEGCMVNHFFGSLVFQERLKTDEEFDANKFLELANDDKVLADLMKKFNKTGTNKTAKSQNVVNQIQEIYENYFIKMSGGEVEKSYAEKVKECKDLRTKLNKDKSLTKLTGSRSIYDIEQYMMNIIKKGRFNDLEFTMVARPEKEDQEGFGGGRIPIDYGIIKHKVSFIDFWKYNSLCNEEMRFEFHDPETGTNWKIEHNYAGGYGHGYSKKYTKATCKFDKEIYEKYGVRHMNEIRDIEVWINIPKSAWERK